MFFKKKSAPEPPAFGGSAIFMELATELYKAVGKPDGSSSVSATFEFDDQYRVSNIKNPIANGSPKVPPFELVETLNSIAQPLNHLPTDQKIRSLVVNVENGQISTEVKHLND